LASTDTDGSVKIHFLDSATSSFAEALASSRGNLDNGRVNFEHWTTAGSGEQSRFHGGTVFLFVVDLLFWRSQQVQLLQTCLTLRGTLRVPHLPLRRLTILSLFGEFPVAINGKVVFVC
jgi:hypothetical protein